MYMEQFPVQGGVIAPFSKENVDKLHAFFEENAGLYSLTRKDFLNATIDDEDFDPEFSLVLFKENKIIAAVLAIFRKTTVSVKKRKIPYTFTTLNMFAVARGHRRQGIGSAMLGLLVDRLKRRGRKKIRVMASPPRYLWPGLDPRYTAGFFFLKTNGFKRGKGERKNLIVDLPQDLPEPPRFKEGVTFSRATMDDLDAAIEYVRANHDGLWSAEVPLSFRDDPPTTFVAKDEQGTIVGFASHSIQFEGSFGPTGVSKSWRGKGIGGSLLKWCMWDLKARGHGEMIICWVEGDTIKFYSKSTGARVHHVYWTMKRKI